MLKLHPDHGEGQQWSRSPGNLYSKPQRVEVQRFIDGAVGPHRDDTADRSSERYEVRKAICGYESKLLTEFWGRPVFLEATVLVPRDFDEEPSALPRGVSAKPFRRRLF